MLGVQIIERRGHKPLPLRPAATTAGYLACATSDYRGKLFEHCYTSLFLNKKDNRVWVYFMFIFYVAVWEHKNCVIPGFTAKYRVHQLAYYEQHENYYEAARREKCLKNWYRQWKIDLIEKTNPNWNDLYESICY